MPTTELYLALLATVPRHGDDVAREHGAWFPDARPPVRAQVRATLARLVRDGLAEVVGTSGEESPGRTLHALTPAGRERLARWLAAPTEAPGGEELVRRAVAALRTAPRPGRVLADQRTAHLRRVRELTSPPAGAGEVVGEGPDLLVRRHAVLHLDADLRWLDEALAAVPETVEPAGPTEPARPGRTDREAR